MAQPEITPNQLKCINTLVGKLKISKEDKAVMVSGFSATGKESSRELLYTEAVELIRHLKKLDPQEKDCEPMRKKILHYAHLLGWTKQSIFNKTVADVARVDEWMKQYSYLKKKLYSYTYDELPKLVTQVEKFYKDVTSKM